MKAEEAGGWCLGLSQEQAELCKRRSFLWVCGSNLSMNLEPSQTSTLAVPNRVLTFQPYFLETKHKANLPRTKHLILSISREGRRVQIVCGTGSLYSLRYYIPLCLLFPSAKPLNAAGVPASQAFCLLHVISRYWCSLHQHSSSNHRFESSPIFFCVQML